MIVTNAIVTAYCICYHCCHKVDGIGYYGAAVIPGVSAAANHLKCGTWVDIPGIGSRVIQDRMAKRYTGRIDVLMESHQAAKKFGKRRLTVRIYE